MDDTPIMAVGRWRDNAHLMADVARMEPGYLDGTVLDATYGDGKFWTKHRPARLVTNDLHKPADHALDFRTFSEQLGDGTFDSVVFDPDYKLNGTPAVGSMDIAYGTAENLSRTDRLGKIVAGAMECYCVTRRWLLVKCMDQVEGGRMRWQTDMVTRAVEDLGGRKVERFDLLGGGRPQPPRTKKCKACNGLGTWTATADEVRHGAPPPPAPFNTCGQCDGSGRVESRQQHAYGRGSTLLIFKKG